MRDLVFFLIFTGFFVLVVLFVRACDLILGGRSAAEAEPRP